MPPWLPYPTPSPHLLLKLGRDTPSKFIHTTHIYLPLCFQSGKKNTDRMATPIQEDLLIANTEYSNAFDKGSLPLPPAKKYLVGAPPL